MQFYNLALNIRCDMHHTTTSAMVSDAGRPESKVQKALTSLADSYRSVRAAHLLSSGLVAGHEDSGTKSFHLNYNLPCRTLRDSWLTEIKQADMQSRQTVTIGGVGQFYK